MNQISGTTPTGTPVQEQQASQPADVPAPPDRPDLAQTGFGARGRARRRVRFLRKARELAYRDLGGLVFNLHRFGQRNDPLVVAKLSMLERIDAELRAIEGALQERQTVTVLREAGITACPRCAAIHGSEDRFCPNCGLSMGPHADLPIAGAASAPAVANPSTPAPVAAGAPAPAAAPAPVAPAPVAPAATPAAQAPAPAAPARTGRSPTAPTTPQTPAPEPPTQSQTAVPERDEPTEILHPPSVSQ